jgi:hypothetical protein
MQKNQKRIQVVKIPLNGFPTIKPQIFPDMPRLYLELIENKLKIRQDLINKEHIPTKYSSVDSNVTVKDSQTVKNELPQTTTIPVPVPTNIPLSQTKEKFTNRLDMLLSDCSSSGSDDENESYGKSISSSSTVSELSIVEVVQKQKTKTTSKPTDDPPDDNRDDTPSEVSDDLSIRLKELLNEDSDTNSEYNKKSTVPPVSNKYTNHRDRSGNSVSRAPSPPTLAELEQRGGYIPRKELRDISQPYNEQHDDEDNKRELLFKFELLRKSYPGSSMPEYTIHTDLSTMKKSYSDCVRRLSLDSSVENYKQYLVYGFTACEFILGNYLGFDMEGFTGQQVITMHSYDKMLIELGEKSYVPSGSKFPVELRLLFMIIMNAAFFIISKMMMKKTGSNLMGMINGMMNTGGSTNTNSTPAPKRKMRGPSVDIL